jgi:hypothetical protein
MSESIPMKAVKLDRQGDNFQRILESAVVVSWRDLKLTGPSDLVHIKYDFATSGMLDYVQVWSSIKWGYWLLACTYSMSASQSHGNGVHFDNGYESQGLGHILEVVMQHQNLFELPENLGREGLLQIVAPVEKESKLAAVFISDAFDRVNSFAEQRQSGV